MDEKDIKQLLSAFDPKAADDEEIFDDMRRALAEDADLRANHERELDFDNALRAKIKEISPPPELRERILAGMEQATAQPDVSAEPEEIAEADILPFEPVSSQIQAAPPAPWWHSTRTWGIAASVVLILGLGSLMFDNGRSNSTHSPIAQTDSNSAEVERVLAAIVEHSSNIDGLDYRTEDVDSLRAFLASHNSPSPSALPVPMEKMPGVGCLSLALDGKQIGLICFKGDKVYHLFVADRKDFPMIKETTAPLVRQFGETGAAAWTSNDQLYVLTAKGPMDRVASELF